MVLIMLFWRVLPVYNVGTSSEYLTYLGLFSKAYTEKAHKPLDQSLGYIK